MIVIPTILEKDISKAEERILGVKEVTKWIQIDVCDSFWEGSRSFELELLTKIEGIENNLLDMHLMVKNPGSWINKCIFAGGSRIIGQVEMMDNREDFVDRVKNEGLEAGLAFDIETQIEGEIPSEIDIILLMARRAGVGVYEFDDKVMNKIEELKRIRNEKGMDFLIGVDGGIGVEEAGKLKTAGVDVLYCGSNYFEVKNVI